MEFFVDRNEFLQSLKSHMTPGHNTNSALDKDLHQISKEEMGTDNRELDTLVESYKIRVGNDIGKIKYRKRKPDFSFTAANTYGTRLCRK